MVQEDVVLLVETDDGARRRPLELLSLDVNYLRDELSPDVGGPHLCDELRRVGDELNSLHDEVRVGRCRRFSSKAREEVPLETDGTGPGSLGNGPAMSQLRTKPSWSGLVGASAATSRATGRSIAPATTTDKRVTPTSLANQGSRRRRETETITRSMDMKSDFR